MAEIRIYTKEELAQMPFGEVVDYINELYAGYYKYKKEALYKEDCLKDTIEHQMDEIVKLKNLLFEKNRTIEEQCNKIDDMETEIDHLTERLDTRIGYSDLDLVDKQRKRERLKNLLNSVYGKPMNFVLEHSNSSYSEYAIHLMRKYEALTDQGFSHDDAMSLIPMWDDADFENFKKGN